MPIKSYTGLPGHGKTSLMVEDLLAESKKAERALFAAGIDGLQPGIATILKDPRDWNAVKPGMICTCHDTEDSTACDSHVVPNGSLIFVDEAWKWFGHLQNATRQSTPDHVLALAEHRHRGIDFVWTFQQPCQIYPFARGLMADHYHVVRRFGTSFIDVFKWEELNEDVKSGAKREAAQRTTRTLPSEAWKSYKSAELHTIKRRIPLKVMALPVMFVVAAGLLYTAYASMKPAEAAPKRTDKRPEAALAAPAETDDKGSRFDSLADYVAAHQPRIPTMPWSAPVFDKRAVTSDPQLYCVSSGAGEDAMGEWREESCSCMTEQGTPYALSRNECRMVARRGAPYNPYRDRRRDAREAQQTAQSKESSKAPAGVVLDAAQVTGYGDIGAGES